MGDSQVVSTALDSSVLETLNEVEIVSSEKDRAPTDRVSHLMSLCLDITVSKKVSTSIVKSPEVDALYSKPCSSNCSGNSITAQLEHDGLYASKSLYCKCLKSNIKECSEVIGDWTAHEQSKSSTWRETEAVSRIIRSHVNVLRNSIVKVYSDNKNVQSVLLNGSRKNDIQYIAIGLHQFCEDENIVIQPEWIPRDGNEKADHLSRCRDSDDWEISDDIFVYLNSAWGPYSIDRFASHLNRKCKRFNSRWWVPGTEAVDAFSQYWGQDLNWLVPPPRLISLCLEKIFNDRANCTMVIPEWKSGPFWPCLLKDENNFKTSVEAIINLPRSKVIIVGKGNNGIFARDPLPFNMLAVKIVHR